MTIDDLSLIAFVKSWWLLFLIILFIGVVAWVYRPGNRKRFNREAKSILKDDDIPPEQR